MPESASSHTHRAIVTFGRPITDKDLRTLQSTTDALEARLEPIDIDSDHVHGEPQVAVSPE